jgi:hypothetical protein
LKIYLFLVSILFYITLNVSTQLVLILKLKLSLLGHDDLKKIFMSEPYITDYVLPDVKLNRTSSQNKDIQKIDSSNRCWRHCPSQCVYERYSPWTSTILNIIRGGGRMPLKRALARTMASAFWLRITVTPKSLENHGKNQEVGLLCSLFCDFVSFNTKC